MNNLKDLLETATTSRREFWEQVKMLQSAQQDIRVHDALEKVVSGLTALEEGMFALRLLAEIPVRRQDFPSMVEARVRVEHGWLTSIESSTQLQTSASPMKEFAAGCVKAMESTPNQLTAPCASVSSNVVDPPSNA